MMSIPKPGSLIFLQDYQTTQQNGSTNYCPGTGSCNTNPKQRQHNAPSEKLEPFTWGEKRMDTKRQAKTPVVLCRSKITRSCVAPHLIDRAWRQRPGQGQKRTIPLTNEPNRKSPIKPTAVSPRLPSSNV